MQLQISLGGDHESLNSVLHHIESSGFILAVRNDVEIFKPDHPSREPGLHFAPLSQYEFSRGTFFPSLSCACPCTISFVEEGLYYDHGNPDVAEKTRLQPGKSLNIVVDPHLVSAIVYSLCWFPRFRLAFERWAKQIYAKKLTKRHVPHLRIVLDQTTPSKFDWAWEDRIWMLCMLNELAKEHLAWLSTLGGAFSALGKIGFRAFAERAGKISVSQLRLAVFLGDPILMARSRIYVALSLIQQEKYGLAKRILRRELALCKSELVSSEADKLESIIRSVWMHLVFEKQQRKTLEEERNLVKRAARLVFDDETMRSKKSLADTILAMSSLKLVHSVC